jgi:metal-responsive CopG/Arc/MetJ family transcriptional regulator
MFTKGDLNSESIDGEKMITFQPNTIVYAVPAKSNLAKTIVKANLGVVWHTTYKGKDFASMKASFGVNLKGLKQKPTVWYQDAEYKDVSGTATLTKVDTDEVTEALSKAGKIFQKIKSTTLTELENNLDLSVKIETFNNTLVRKGERISSTSKHVQDLIKWFNEKYKKEYEKRKSEKGKLAVLKKQEEEMKFFSKENKKNLDLMFQLMNAIVDAKLIIINKLDKVKQIDTFVRTRNGFKVTGSEGFVAIDNQGGAVKLVDRMEFSMNNFSKDVIKGWER